MLTAQRRPNIFLPLHFLCTLHLLFPCKAILVFILFKTVDDVNGFLFEGHKMEITNCFLAEESVCKRLIPVTW